CTQASSRLSSSNATATTELYTLSLHDALPICQRGARVRPIPGPQRPSGCQVCRGCGRQRPEKPGIPGRGDPGQRNRRRGPRRARSEEHTSELQSRENLVCRLLLEKKKKNQRRI